MIDRTPRASTALDWQAARSVAFGAISPLGVESVELPIALGRVTAEPVTALQPIPHAVTSAMDGWAVAGPPPWKLEPVGTAPLRRGQAIPIVTGAPIAVGVDAVLRSEFGWCADGVVDLRDGRSAPQPMADIRPIGEEAAAGEELIPSSTILNPAHLAVAAACARDSLTVMRQARVAILLSGDEVIDAGAPGPNQVRDSYGLMLPALVASLDGVVVSTQRLPDLRAATRDAIAEARDAELVITTGGTGGSTADHIRPVLHQLGAELLVDGLSAQPGGPTMLARLPDGRLLAALAGNPLAAVTGLLVVVAPALAAWGGVNAPPLHSVTPARELAGHARVTMLSPYVGADEGVAPSEWVGSAMMRGLAEARGIMSIPPGGLYPGQQTAAMPVPWSAA